MSTSVDTPTIQFDSVEDAVKFFDEASEALEAAQAAVEAESRKRRQVVAWLRHEQDYKLLEVAAATGLSKTRVTEYAKEPI